MDYFDLFSEIYYCRRHNGSINRFPNISGGEPFDHGAAWNEMIAACAADVGKSYTNSFSYIFVSLSRECPFGFLIISSEWIYLYYSL